MKKKVKNPLYVVKGDQVEQATNFLDVLIKKMNLEPLVELIGSLLKMLIENVQNYQAFIVLKNFIDQLMGKLELFRKFAIL